MSLFNNKYRVESIRLKGWDYSWPGLYFLTICTKNRELFFGGIKSEYFNKSIKAANIILSNIGRVADKFWLEIPNKFNDVKLDEYILMPNHFHGIIGINNNNVETLRGASLPRTFGPLSKNSLLSIINHYKGSVKKWCNKNKLNNFSWQSRFYDHIIRNEKELNRIRNYIINNPLKWELDRNNSSNLYM
ncbi:MAG: transposase [Patescibacteria group bacterium]